MTPGAFWGSVLGCTLWALLLIGLLAKEGRGDLVLEVGVPSLLLGLGTALGVVHAMDRMGRRAGFGLMGIMLGALMQLGNAWILPALYEAGWKSEGQAALMVQPVPQLVITGCLLVGCALLIAEWRARGSRTAPAGD